MNTVLSHSLNVLLAHSQIQYYPSPRPYLTVYLSGRHSWHTARNVTNELVLLFQDAGIPPTEWASSATGKIDIWFPCGNDAAIRALINRLQPEEHPLPLPMLAHLLGTAPMPPSLPVMH